MKNSPVKLLSWEFFTAAMLNPSLKSRFMQKFSRFSRILANFSRIKKISSLKNEKKTFNKNKKASFYKKNNKKRKNLSYIYALCGRSRFSAKRAI